ncbi:D-2-hydroxyacid dehydrogenase family protein [Phyllobacterium sp. SB3]|uniref:D-2-hydroxyacid dehydrogenase family protein n=1 Tax=Phyllobacterium sp. SB3 TaxID=3156073 RepID=UPI0032AF12D0
MKIGIPDDYANVVDSLQCFGQLDGHDVTIWNDAERDVDILAERFRDIEALVLLRERTQLPAALICRLPKLRLITLNGPHPNVDVEACTGNGTLICVGHGRISYATAELTWGLVLAGMRSIPQQMARLRAGGWQSELGTGLRDRTLGVLGYGKVGSVVASYGRAFGMKVLVWSRDGGLAAAEAAGHTPCPNRRVLFEQADVLSLHVRYTKETAGIVTADDLAAMKPTSLIVNTSRSGLIAPGALLEALKCGRPGRAAVDVYETEPSHSEPLLALSNVVATPHLGYFERDQIEAYFGDQFHRVLAYVDGRPIDVENPDALAGMKGFA